MNYRLMIRVQARLHRLMPCRQHRCSHLLHFQLQWHSDETFLAQCWGGKQKRVIPGKFDPIVMYHFVSVISNSTVSVASASMATHIWKPHEHLLVTWLNHASMHSCNLAAVRKPAATTTNNNKREQWIQTRTSSELRHIWIVWCQ